MKRLLSILCLTALAVSLLAGSALAVYRYHTIPELDISVALPDENIIFTRDIDENDPNLEPYGFDKEILDDFFVNSDVYLWSWDEDINYDIMISAVLDVDIDNMSEFDKEEIANMTDYILERYHELGYTIFENGVHESDHGKFLMFRYSEPDGDSERYVLEYITFYNNNAIHFEMNPYENEFTSKLDYQMTRVIDSVKFGKPKQAKKPVTETPAEEEAPPAAEVPEKEEQLSARDRLINESVEILAVAAVLAVVVSFAAGFIAGRAGRGRRNARTGDCSDAPWEL